MHHQLRILFIARLPDNLEVGLLPEQVDQSPPHHRMVVHHHHPKPPHPLAVTRNIHDLPTLTRPQPSHIGTLS